MRGVVVHSLVGAAAEVSVAKTREEVSGDGRQQRSESDVQPRPDHMTFIHTHTCRHVHERDTRCAGALYTHTVLGQKSHSEANVVCVFVSYHECVDIESSTDESLQIQHMIRFKLWRNASTRQKLLGWIWHLHSEKKIHKPLLTTQVCLCVYVCVCVIHISIEMMCVSSFFLCFFLQFGTLVS